MNNVNHTGNVKNVNVEASYFSAAFWQALPSFVTNVRGTHVDYVVDKNQLNIDIKFRLGEELIQEPCKFFLISC